MSADHRGRMIGPYRFIDRLGQGGMGTVWRARDEQLERDVAIKMINPTGDEDLARENAARLLIEAKSEACIKSNHVAQVLQLGSTEQGEVYIVMELLEGKTLLDVLVKERRLPAHRAVRIARQIAKGMDAAHQLGIVHRDLKPANVMLVRVDGEDEVAKVLDFGIAKRTKSSDEAITDVGVLLGTLHFMSPEQIEGREVDPRADIYSLGVLIYRMLAGRAPFEGSGLRELSDLVLNTPPKSLVEMGLNIPAALDDVVLKCLAKAPGDRFQTMGELEAALSVVIDGVPRSDVAPTLHAVQDSNAISGATRSYFNDGVESAAHRQPTVLMTPGHRHLLEAGESPGAAATVRAGDDDDDGFIAPPTQRWTGALLVVAVLLTIVVGAFAAATDTRARATPAEDAAATQLSASTERELESAPRATPVTISAPLPDVKPSAPAAAPTKRAHKKPPPRSDDLTADGFVRVRTKDGARR